MLQATIWLLEPIDESIDARNAICGNAVALTTC